MTMKTWLASLAAVVLLAGLAGCGGDDPEPQTDDSTTAAEPVTPTARETSAPPRETTEPAETPEATESAETTEPGTPAEQVVITIQDFEFSDLGPVSAGTDIVVENQDEATHTVTAEGDGGFDITINGGETATFTAPSQAGDYPFICTFHPGMTSTLVVE